LNNEGLQLRTLLEVAVVAVVVPHHESTCDSMLPTLTISCWGHTSGVSETISIIKEICNYTPNEDKSIKYNYCFNI
jgi:hypothetical protein